MPMVKSDGKFVGRRERWMETLEIPMVISGVLILLAAVGYGVGDALLTPAPISRPLTASGMNLRCRTTYWIDRSADQEERVNSQEIEKQIQKNALAIENAKRIEEQLDRTIRDSRRRLDRARTALRRAGYLREV